MAHFLHNIAIFLAFSSCLVDADAHNTGILFSDVSVVVDASQPIAFTSERFVGYNFDWHPNGEEPPLWINCSVQLINFSNPTLIAAVRNLPTRLRVGGSEQDQVIYNVHGSECAAADVDAAFCLSMSRWREIVSFANDNNIELIFGLNAMNGRVNATSPMDFANLRDFLNFTFTNQLKVYGFELGNELPSNKIDPRQDAEDFRTVYGIIHSLWGADPAQDVPKLIGNDLNPMNISSYNYSEFFTLVGSSLDVFTYHNYDGYGLDSNLTNEIVTPQFLNKTADRMQAIFDIYQPYAQASKMQLFAGELAAAWHSGQENTTNAFVSSFWYADALARLASLNHTGFLRQTLIGGAYGLLSRNDYAPNPDYYTGKLFHDLVSDVLLDASIVGRDDSGGFLRVYSYCSRRVKGAVGVLLINISPNMEFNVSLSVESPNANGGDAVTSLEVWQLSAESLHAKFMKLNGKELRMVDEATLPCLTECPAALDGDTVSVAPYTIAYVDVRTANVVSLCDK